MHAGLKGTKTLSTFKRQRDILDGLELDMAEKGLTKYYTLVKTPRQWRYALHQGFTMTGEIITGTPYAIMAKEL